MFSVAILLSTALAQKPNETAPSYEDTLYYIQERLDGGLEEISHCQFVFHGSADERLDDKLLSPDLSWEDKYEASINSGGGKLCVQYSELTKPRDF